MPEMMAPGRAASRWPARYDSKVAESSQICTISRITIKTIAPSIAVRPRFCGGLDSCAFSLHADRHQLAVLLFQCDARQRALRRALASPEPSAIEKKPWWQGHSSRFCSFS